MHVNRNPHSSWAEVYDLVYTRSFGDFYNNLTDATIQVITDRLSPGGRIVDFGAGTGRLSIPLADKKFEVTAVDPCREMLCQLEKKKREGMNLRTTCSKMEDFKENNFDFALCVFTVLAYFLDEESLKKSLSAAHGALNSDGILFIDIPFEKLFKSSCKKYKDDVLERLVTVTEENENICHYQEESIIRESSGNESTYSDEFKIRYWPSKYVSDIMRDIGFTLEADLMRYPFSAACAHYWIMKKAE